MLCWTTLQPFNKLHLFLSFVFCFELLPCYSYHLVQRWPTSDKRSWRDDAEAWPSAGDWTGSAVWCWDVQMCSSQPGRSCWDISQPAGVRWVTYLPYYIYYSVVLYLKPSLSFLVIKNETQSRYTLYLNAVITSSWVSQCLQSSPAEVVQ